MAICNTWSQMMALVTQKLPPFNYTLQYQIFVQANKEKMRALETDQWSNNEGLPAVFTNSVIYSCFEYDAVILRDI